MALQKIRIGSFVEQLKIKCNIPNLTPDDVSGINKDKEFFEPSKQVGGDTSEYKIVPPGCFACNLMHVGRDVVLPIALNDTNKDKIVSPAYTVFKFTDESQIIKKYFFMYLKSSEKDRFFWFHTDSSVRDGMDWDVFENLYIQVPSINIQKKFVEAFISLEKNFLTFSKKMDDFKLLCDIYIENIRRINGTVELKNYLFEKNEKNSFGEIKNEKGISTKKELTIPKAVSSDIRGQKILRKNNFGFATNTARNADKLSIALNEDDDCIVSNTYCTFSCTGGLNPKYLNLWFRRSEFDRYVRYHSWGSVREMFYFKDLEKVRISIPSLEIQNKISNILLMIEKRISYYKRLKIIYENIGSVLISGSLLQGED